MTVTDVCDDELLAGHDVASFARFYLGVAGGVLFIGTDSGVSAVDAATGRVRWTRDLRATQVNNGNAGGFRLLPDPGVTQAPPEGRQATSSLYSFRSLGTCSSCPFGSCGRRTWRTRLHPPTR